jgi:PAS domain S-box-containing protein
MKSRFTRRRLLVLASLLWTALALAGWACARWGGESGTSAGLLLVIFFGLGGLGLITAADAVFSRRLRRLCEALRETRARGDDSSRLNEAEWQDLLELAGEINGLLSAIEQARENLRSVQADLERRLAEQTAELVASRQALAEDAARRVEAERAGAERERVYRTLHELAPIGILIESENGTILDVNQALCEIIGYTRDELVGQSVDMLADRRFHPRIRQDIARLLEGHALSHEVENRRKDGSTCYVDLRERAITLPDGTRRIIVAATDITARKTAEKRLRESELRYLSLFNAVITGFAINEMIWDEHGEAADFMIIDVNPAFSAIMGMRRDDVIGRRASEVFPTIEKHCLARYGAVARTGKSDAFETYMPHLNKYLSVIAFSPRPGQFAINFIDITEQRRANDLIRLQSAALESAANGIMIVERSGAITWVNKAFTELTGYEREELIGRRPNIFKSGKHSDEFYADLWKTVLEGKLWRGEIINRRKDGSLYYEELIITPVLGEDGAPSHFVAIKQDITERRVMQQRLFDAQKMETIGRLAGGIAHDFNNLLQAITGFSHLLLEQMGPDNPYRDDVQEIDRAARRAADLTRQLLAFGRKQMIETRIVDLNTVVKNTQKMLVRLIGEDIQLDLQLEPNLDPVRVDPGQIEQVLVNLAVNARDAMPGGGRLTIATRSIVLLKEDDLFADEQRHGRFVVLDVTDTGVGMPPEVRERIFEPFFTTKGPGRGTGLGLSVVYGIVRQHEGMIHVYSEPGHGTNFRIYLPVGDESATASAAERLPASKAEGPPRGRNERILLVEDEQGVRDFAINALRQYGYQPIATENAAEAARVFEELNGQVDMLFTDVVLPDQTGLDLAAALRARRPDLRLLLTSGYMDEKSRWPVIRERGYPFLQKPYPLNALLTIVRRVLDAPAPPA